MYHQMFETKEDRRERKRCFQRQQAGPQEWMEGGFGPGRGHGSERHGCEGRGRHGFGGPWRGRWERGFGGGRLFDAGDLKLVILKLLSEEPSYGYQLMKTMETRTGGAYRASAGAVYPTLQQMEDEGLVTSEQKDGKRVYQITEAGKAEVARNAEAIRELWERAGGGDDWREYFGPHVASMAGPAAHVMKAAVRAAARSRDDPDKTAKIFTILDQARRDLDAIS